MKNLLLKILVSVAVLFAFNGCGGDDDTIIRGNENVYVGVSSSGQNIGYNDKVVNRGEIRVPRGIDYIHNFRTKENFYSYISNGVYCVNGSFEEGDIVRIYYPIVWDGYNNNFATYYNTVVTRKMLRNREIW